MSHFQAVYYRDSDRNEPVSEFIDELRPDRQVVLDNQIDRLNMLSDAMPHLPFPHSSQIAKISGSAWTPNHGSHLAPRGVTRRD